METTREQAVARLASQSEAWWSIAGLVAALSALGGAWIGYSTAAMLGAVIGAVAAVIPVLPLLAIAHIAKLMAVVEQTRP